jgi:hypothetical protein
MAKEARRITVEFPVDPPQLTPGAARVMLKILIAAYEKQQAREKCEGAQERAPE